MTDPDVFILGSAAVSAFGTSVAENCDALLSGRTAFAEPRHFDGKGRLLGLDPALDGGTGSRAVRLLARLRDALDFRIPAGTRLFVATTVGTIDELETSGDTVRAFQAAAETIFGLSDSVLVSAACASGQTAVALAMRELKAGKCRHALVAGGDIASEFVTSGFAALGALSRTVCRPYDSARDGLTLGEAAAAVLLTCAEPGPGRLLAAAETCDAAHITAPDLSGRELRNACLAASAGLPPPGGIIGHGTGTVYNDQAEIAALQAVFPGGMPPVFSLKGNFGHTLGATGVLQLALGLELARRRRLPPQAGLQTPMPGANVAATARELASPVLWSLNVGFGGLNSITILEAL